MQFFKLSAIVATLLSAAAVTEAADWNQRATQECGLRSWTAIKASVDSLIQTNLAFMPPPLKMALQQAKVLNADNSLISNPSLEQIALIANTLPQGLFHPYADTIVEQCLTNPPTLPNTSASPTSTSSSTSTHSSSSTSTSTQSSSSPSSSSTQSSLSPSSTSTQSSSSPSSSSTQSSSDSTSTQTSSDSTNTQSSSSSTTDVPPSSTPCTTSTTTTPVVPSSMPIKCIPRPHY